MTTTEYGDAMLARFVAEIAEYEAIQRYKGFMVADLRKVFDALCDPQDWQGPITATMPGEAVLAATTAIEFFTGTVPRVVLNMKTRHYVVESEGYRAGPCGDH
jgi:hypothetical protein